MRCSWQVRVFVHADARQRKTAMNRLLIAAPLALAALFATGAAEASRVRWSVGIDVPAVGVAVSGGPGYYGAPPPAYAPPPRYVSAPFYREPAYFAPPFFVAPRPPHLWLPPLPRPHWAWGHDRRHHGGGRR